MAEHSSLRHLLQVSASSSAKPDPIKGFHMHLLETAQALLEIHARAACGNQVPLAEALGQFNARGLSDLVIIMSGHFAWLMSA